MSLTVSYNKLWKLLVDKKMSKADLRRAVEISPNTMTKTSPRRRGFYDCSETDMRISRVQYR